MIYNFKMVLEKMIIYYGACFTNKSQPHSHPLSVSCSVSSQNMCRIIYISIYEDTVNEEKQFSIELMVK